MITKAIIEKVISDYEVKVRIPLLDSTTAFKQSVDIDGLSSATICISPKSRFIPAVGDIVFVAFEDNDAGKPVIIGCLQKETGNISSLDLNVESLNASSSINLSNNTTIGDLSYEKINSLFDIKDQEIDDLKKRDIVKLYDAVGQNIDGAMTQKATTDALAKKMDNFSISIGSTNGGNPRQVKFMSINYTTSTSEAGVSIKLSMASGHGNGSSYRFLQDAILGVTYTGVVSVDVYKYYNASVGTFDGATRNYGDIFYVKDETNKIVDFYVLLGQYSTVKVTPYFRLNSSTGGIITQLSGTPAYYSSGTKVYGNNSLYATKSDIPSVSQSTGTSTTEVMSQKATTDALNSKMDSSAIKQSTGTGENVVMSQKATTDELTSITTTLSNFNILLEKKEQPLSYSFQQNGFIKYASGLIIQWGYGGEGTANTKTLTFRTPFSDKNYSVVAINTNTGASDNYALQVENYSTTQFRAHTTYNSSKRPIMYIAIGY